MPHSSKPSPINVDVVQQAAALPWKYEYLVGSDYYCWGSELTDQQQQLLESFPRYFIEKKIGGSVSFKYRTGDVFYEVKEGSTLHQPVTEAFAAKAAQYMAMLQDFSWQFNEQGNLTLANRAEIVPADPLLQPIWQELLVDLQLHSEEGSLLIKKPPYRSSHEYIPVEDNHVLRWQKQLYNALGAVVADRNEQLLAAMPWQGDWQKMQIYVNAKELSPPQQALAEHILQKNQEFFILNSFAASDGLCAPRQFKKTKIEQHITNAFLQEGAHNHPLECAANFPFEPPLTDLYNSQANGLNEVADFMLNWVAAEAEKQIEQQFIKAHLQEIRLLPWVYGLTDNVTNINAIRLYHEDILPEQQPLVQQLEQHGYMSSSHDKQRFLVKEDVLGLLLASDFQAAQPLIVEQIAALPWEVTSNGSAFMVAKAALSNKQAGQIFNLVDELSVGDEEKYCLDGDQHQKSHILALQRALASAIISQQKAVTLPEWVKELPWQYDVHAFDKSQTRDVVLTVDKITPQQLEELQKILPQDSFRSWDHIKQTSANDNKAKGNNNSANKGCFRLKAFHELSDDLAGAVLAKPYVDVLVPIIEAQVKNTAPAKKKSWRNISFGW
ncbi:MAG: hypothetical protein ACOYK8_01645 [Alphaproteobacteria bacterium]